MSQITVPTAEDAAQHVTSQEAQAPAWSAVLAMSLCVFVLIASEFMPVSLLTPLASDLRLTEGQAGQAIGVSGAFAVLTSLSIAALAGRTDRKIVLIALTLAMAASGSITAFAVNYPMFAVGRALLGVVIGGFWSMSAATAMRLVPQKDVTKALAIFNGGNALATVLAAPLGSFLGSMIGWRSAFFCFVPLALVVLVWQSVSLPPLKVTATSKTTNVVALLARPAVAMGMAAVGFFFMGQFMLFTYLRPFLETIARVDVGTLSMLFLAMGVSGFIGTVLVGRLIARSLYAPAILFPAILALIATGLVAFGANVPATAILLSLWGLLATAAPVGWWTWVSRTLPNDAEVGGGLLVAVIQLAITVGSTLGGLLFDTRGYATSFTVAAVLLIGAAVLALLTARISARANGLVAEIMLGPEINPKRLG